MTDRWRLALMFDARSGDLKVLGEGLGRAEETIRGLVGDAHIRLGVADRDPSLAGPTQTEPEAAATRTVDGAVEVTVSAARADELPQLARSLREALEPLAAPGSIEVMAGPVYSMVPARDGGTFLSLAFRRDPATTSEQFKTWWRHQHAGVAIPVLGPGMLAYDQVHLDHAAAETIARAAGVEPVAYDAYDNLTWADMQGFFTSISDPVGMARVYADEVGRIQAGSQRHAMMRKIG